MIAVKNIVKTYYAGDSKVEALKDVSMSFRESEFVSILGPSGCGKTTLLNVLGGLDKYDCGDLIIDNISTKNYKDKDWDTYRNHEVGFIFQNYNLIPHLSIVENVELSLTIGGTNKKDRRQKAINALKEVGLLDKVNKKPNQLSGGQMQRVAIARAIVNNPKIILADEPTGALDSETSVQVMDILKKLSLNHLIIMVTHNREIAENYSTRIINLLDGKVVSDTMPLKNEEQIKTKNIKTKKTAMKFLTAIYLSFKNLLSKKTRTIITSIAGSIGIIGIALVLAVSNGFTGYINQLQSDSLAGYPIAISTVAIDLNSISKGTLKENDTKFPDNNYLTPYNISANYASYSQYNYLSPEFIDYIKEYEQKDVETKKELNSIEYSYSSPLHILTKYNNDTVIPVPTDSSLSIMSGATSSIFYEGSKNKEFVLSQYDVLYGTYPQNKNEVALVINSTNKVPKNILNALGIATPLTEEGFANIDFDSLVGENAKEFQVVLNNEYYTPVYTSGEITDFEPASESNFLSLYDNSNNITLKISAIMRIKETSKMELYSSGIVYSPELTDYINQYEQESLIVTTQRLQTDKLFVPYSITISEIGLQQDLQTISEIKNYVNNTYNIAITSEQCIEYALQGVGASSIPISIRFFPKNFDAKDNIINYINEWNDSEKGLNNKITYSDATAILSSTLGNLVNIISYVLIAFAGISLVVSSIMIGIITYVSVIERTKEIGVLRSIGARKKDISRVFNAETLMIGLTAGIIGVFITFILTFPINAILISVSSGAVTTSLAVLKPSAAIILIAISTILTLISGLIPSRIASKKDPVKALRTE